MAFITLRQANVVASPGGTVKGSPLTNSEVDNNFANINLVIGFREDLQTSNTANLVAAVNELNQEIGNVLQLTTTTTSNLVAAVNEVRSTVNANVGSLSALTTTATNNTVAAINEVNAAAASIIPFAIALG
jgi:Zn-dependent oligopeptidase